MVTIRFTASFATTGSKSSMIGYYWLVFMDVIHLYDECRE